MSLTPKDFVKYWYLIISCFLRKKINIPCFFVFFFYFDESSHASLRKQSSLFFSKERKKKKLVQSNNESNLVNSLIFILSFLLWNIYLFIMCVKNWMNHVRCKMNNRLPRHTDPWPPLRELKCIISATTPIDHGSLNWLSNEKNRKQNHQFILYTILLFNFNVKIYVLLLIVFSLQDGDKRRLCAMDTLTILEGNEWTLNML